MKYLKENGLRGLTDQIVRTVTFFTTRNSGGTFWGFNLGLFIYGVIVQFFSDASLVLIIPCLTGGLMLANIGAFWAQLKGEPALDESAVKALAMIDEFERKGGRRDEASMLRQQLAAKLVESAGGEIRFLSREDIDSDGIGEA